MKAGTRLGKGSKCNVGKAGKPLAFFAVLFIALSLATTSLPVISSEATGVGDISDITSNKIKGLEGIGISANELAFEVYKFAIGEINKQLAEEGSAKIIVLLDRKIDKEKFITELEALDSNSVSATPTQKNFKLRYKYNTINAFSGEFSREALVKILKSKDIIAIEPVIPLEPALAETLQILQADQMHAMQVNGQNIDGSGRAICFIDTGIDYTRPDLGGGFGPDFKVVGGFDFGNNDPDPFESDFDPSVGFWGASHGTHVAITGASSELNNGVANGSNIVMIRISGPSGGSTNDRMIAGVDWCLDNKNVFKIKTISTSMRVTNVLYNNFCDSDWPVTATAINNARSSNIPFTASSGNEGSTTSIGAPACIKNAVAVGGSAKPTGGNEIILNRNSITDFVAIAASVLQFNPDNSRALWGGTSISTPQVAAAFALLNHYAEARGITVATVDDFENALKQTGEKLFDPATGLTFPRPLINASTAFLDKIFIPTPIAPPDGSTFTSSSTVIIKWTKIERATQYKFIRNLPDGRVHERIFNSVGVCKTGATECGFIVPQNLVQQAPLGTYKWKVAALISGSQQPFSEEWSVVKV